MSLFIGKMVVFLQNGFVYKLETLKVYINKFYSICFVISKQRKRNEKMSVLASSWNMNHLGLSRCYWCDLTESALLINPS